MTLSSTGTASSVTVSAIATGGNANESENTTAATGATGQATASVAGSAPSISVGAYANYYGGAGNATGGVIDAGTVAANAGTGGAGTASATGIGTGANAVLNVTSYADGGNGGANADTLGGKGGNGGTALATTTGTPASAGHATMYSLSTGGNGGHGSLAGNSGGNGGSGTSVLSDNSPWGNLSDNALAHGGNGAAASNGASAGVGGIATASIDIGSFTFQQSSSASALTGGSAQITIAGTAVTPTYSNTGTLTLSGTLDLLKNPLSIVYGTGPDPLAIVKASIAAAYNNGAWTGAGISSSFVKTNSHYGIGYADVTDAGNPANLPANTLEAKPTLLGDLTLNGTVDQGDIALLAPNCAKASGATWVQGDVNYDGAVDQNDIALIAPNYGQTANVPALAPAAKAALVRSVSPSLSPGGIAAPAVHLYTWDAALPDATAGNVIIKVDNTTGDSHFGDVILQGNSATLYTLVIISASGSMHSGRYNSVNAQYAGGGGSEAATLQGLAVDNTTNHSGNFSVFSQTASKINEAGLGVTLDFTSNAESVDMSVKANNKNLFSGITADLAFSWSGQNGTLVPGAVEYSSPVPEPGMLSMLGVGGVMMMRRRRKNMS